MSSSKITPPPLAVVILAAGKGSRMRSNLPKVLHPIGGRPMLHHVLRTARALQPGSIHLVVGHGADQVRQQTPASDIHWHVQEQQLGTGHAVMQAMPAIPDDARVLVLYGDVPLLTCETLKALLSPVRHSEDVALLTVELPDPSGYGRIVRDPQGNVRAIVEHKDADETTRAIREVNTGILSARAGDLRQWLNHLSNNNAQGEYYLTDIIAMAVAEGRSIFTLQAEDPLEVEGVNNRHQQAALERAFQRRQAERLMAEGVTLIDPNRIDIRGPLHCGRDVTIDVGAVFEGEVYLGDGVTIGAYAVIKDSRIDAHSTVKPHTVIEGAQIGAKVSVGPFARLRPGAQLDDASAVGNFVEIKQSKLGRGSKAGHLAYLGDAHIGENVNIGAGTITCNYDGANKHQTIIEDEVFVGSDTQLVAPVRVARGATIGAGTTVTQDVPERALVISRVRQRHIDNWRRPQKRAVDTTSDEEST